MPFVHEWELRIKGRRAASRYWVDRSYSRGSAILPIPIYRQQDYHSCGFLAALAVTEYLRPEISVREVLGEVLPNNWGIDTPPLLRALRRLGIHTDNRKKGLGWHRLLKAVTDGWPVIVSVQPKDWEYSHWTVIRGLRENPRRVFLTNLWGYDGLRNKDCSMPWGDFQAMWYYGGDGIICSE